MEKSINKAMLKPLENLLHCHICSDFYNNCVITACSHNFCSVCIQRRITTEADCPNCFEVVQKSDLRNNKTMDKMVRFFKKISSRIQSNVDNSEGTSLPQHPTASPVSSYSRAPLTSSAECSRKRTVDAPNRHSSQNAPHIHSIQASLTDITTPIKIEIVDCNESEVAEINTTVDPNSFQNCSVAAVNEDVVEQLLKTVETMQQSMKEVARSAKRIESKFDSLLSTFDIPVNGNAQTIHDQDMNLIMSLPLDSKGFSKLEEKIVRNPAFRKKLMKYLMTCGGNDDRSFITCVLRKLMRDEIAMRFSLTGKTQKPNQQMKQPFQKTEMYRLLLELSFQRTPECKTSMLRETISNWLTQAEFRLRKREIRREKRESTVREEVESMAVTEEIEDSS